MSRPGAVFSILFRLDFLNGGKEQEMSKRAVVLLSGGLNTTTCMGMAQSEGCSLYPLTFIYGQRHAREVTAAREVAEHYGVAKQHRWIPLPLWTERGSSALTDPGCPVPKTRGDEGIPTYVPGRNLVFLSCAIAYAKMIRASEVYLGISVVDDSSDPDCSPTFLDAFRVVVREATWSGRGEHTPKIHSPFLHCSKSEIIAWGLQLEVPYHLTISCHRGLEEACGQCDRCNVRRKGFTACNTEDPSPYAGSPLVSP